MIEAFTADDVRAAEQPLLQAERGFAGGLMDRAATALDVVVRRGLRDRVGRVAGASVVGLVGSGNNGADTLHTLARLARHGVRALAVVTSGSVDPTGVRALRDAGGHLVAVADDAPGTHVWVGDALAEAFAADVVLDGLLGIGGRGGLRGPAADLVSLLTEVRAQVDDEAEAPGHPGAGTPWVIAVDLPSGIGVDDGARPGPVLPADVTVTFGAPKPGLLLPPAERLTGRLEVVELGLRPALGALGRRPAVRRLETADASALWPAPPDAGHKYSRGVVGVVAGTSQYPGAAVLTVSGALRAGPGMVRYVGPDAVRDTVVAAHPEVVASALGAIGPGHVQAWVLGPGLSEDDEQTPSASAALARAADQGVPVVVDAGALALLPERVGPLVVLTPHAGELARLLSARGSDVDRADVEAHPLRWATEAHERTGATVLLKGPTTVVVGPQGVRTQADAPPWLATAGAGDVLAGVLGAILAGRAADLADDPGLVTDLAALAALVHGRAADAANPAGPVTASQVADAVPGVVARLLGSGGAASGRVRGGGPRSAGRRCLPIHLAPRRVAGR